MHTHHRSIGAARHSPRRKTRGFTLVELLVVITIIGILISLLLPAVQSAREAARMVQCKNNIRQVSLAAVMHAEKVKHFPTGGWGWFWIGDPDRGSGSDQPGGWAFNVLPFMEQQNLYLRASDGQPNVITDTQKSAATETVKLPVTMFNCPSRRQAMRFPKPSDGVFVAYNAADNPATDNQAGRIDYAINCGAQGANEYFGGPTAAQVDLANPGAYSGWHDTSSLSGISFERSQVTRAHIRDGLTNTYLVAEKYLNPASYTTGSDGGDNETWCTGFNNDNHRTTAVLPAQDRLNVANSAGFGSAHSSGFNASFCDGSVRTISYSVDAALHLNLGSRADGVVVNLGSL